MPTITIRDSGDLKRLTKALRQAADGKELNKELRRGIRDALRPALAAVKAAYGGGKHLRPALQRASRIEVRTSGKLAGARIRVDGRKMPERMGSLPAMSEGLERWRHPIWGDKERWIQQSPRPVFFRTVEVFEQPVGQEIERVVEQVIRKVERAT